MSLKRKASDDVSENPTAAKRSKNEAEEKKTTTAACKLCGMTKFVGHLSCCDSPLCGPCLTAMHSLHPWTDLEQMRCPDCHYCLVKRNFLGVALAYNPIVVGTFRYDSETIKHDDCPYCKLVDAHIEHVLNCPKRPLFPCPCGDEKCEKKVYREQLTMEGNLVASPANLVGLIQAFHPDLSHYTCAVCKATIAQANIVDHMRKHDQMEFYFEFTMVKLQHLRESCKPHVEKENLLKEAMMVCRGVDESWRKLFHDL